MKKTSQPTMLICQNLFRDEDLDAMLQSLPHLLAWNDIKVIVSGEGCWEELSKSHDLEGVASFAGPVDDEEFSRLYSECDLLVAKDQLDAEPTKNTRNGFDNSLRLALAFDEALSSSSEKSKAAVEGTEFVLFAA